ncbi:VOC family protein [Nocardioides humi]|uniref:VOC family protein n=1 Tax=Nocardioides humi TaxID=449461 RepID=UPI0024830099|nr:VOC family protein [Nocardioides humi]
MTTTAPSPTDVDHIGVIVRSIDVAKKFLGETLGLPLLKETDFPERGTKAAFFQLGGSEIEVIECLHEEARRVRLGDNEARIEHIAVQVPQLNAMLEHLGAVGAQMDAEPIVYDGDLMSFSLPATTMGVRFQFMQKGAGRGAHGS